MKYGIEFNFDSSREVIYILFDGFDLSTYKVHNDSSEIYLMNQQSTYDLYGDNEYYEICKNKFKHFMIDINALFEKENHSIYLYFYDCVAVVLIENYEDYEIIKHNLDGKIDFKIMEKPEVNRYEKFLKEFDGN